MLLLFVVPFEPLNDVSFVTAEFIRRHLYNAFMYLGMNEFTLVYEKIDIYNTECI